MNIQIRKPASSKIKWGEVKKGEVVLLTNTAQPELREGQLYMKLSDDRGVQLASGEIISNSIMNMVEYSYEAVPAVLVIE